MHIELCAVPLSTVTDLEIVGGHGAMKYASLLRGTGTDLSFCILRWTEHQHSRVGDDTHVVARALHQVVNFVNQ